MKKSYSLWCFLMIFCLLGAKQRTVPNEQKLKKNGGVVITFDDKSVEEWAKTDSIFAKKYNWKATYFVMAFHKLKANQKQLLLQLQQHGNEIGYHGTLHTSAVPYIEKNGLEKYLEDEFSQLQPMKDFGLNVRSFAYPSGSRTKLTDSILLQKFQFLRGVTNKEEASKSYNCFYQNGRLVCGIGIEKSYKYFSISYLKELLDYAKKNNKYLVVYAHKPVPTADLTKHEVDYETLDFLCQYVKNNKMKFLTFSELK